MNSVSESQTFIQETITEKTETSEIKGILLCRRSKTIQRFKVGKICKCFALKNCLFYYKYRNKYGSSAVNGCRQNESLNS